MRKLLLLVGVLALATSVGCREDSTGPADQPPVLEIPADLSGLVGQPLDFTVGATDPDGGAVTLDLVPVLTVSEFRQGIKPGAWSFDPDTGEVGFTPNLNDVPARYFELTAVDASGQETRERFPVEVSSP